MVSLQRSYIVNGEFCAYLKDTTKDLLWRGALVLYSDMQMVAKHSNNSLQLNPGMRTELMS